MYVQVSVHICICDSKSAKRAFGSNILKMKVLTDYNSTKQVSDL